MVAILTPMAPDAAAWVRQHVWTPQMRAVEDVIWPGHYTTCACQRGQCHECTRGDHERCQPGGPVLDCEAVILDQAHLPVCFTAPYRHRTPGRRPVPTVVAQVWLADRVCRWVCSCDHTGARPAPAPEPETVPRTSRVYEVAELPLFDLLPA